MAVLVAVPSEAVLAAWLLRSRVRIPLRACMFVPCLCMLCCPKQRPCAELITHPKSPAMRVSEMCDGEGLGLTVTGVTLENKLSKNRVYPSKI
jgi:hypothetical protein